MRVVIDLQGSQTESRFRGIGWYSLSLALAMARNAGEHEIWLALSGAFPESILDIRAAFADLIPPERICVFQVPAPVAESDLANGWRTRAAEKIREHFIQQLRPDVVFVTSLFEGYVDDAVTSVGASAASLQTAVFLYDPIPFFDQVQYLQTAIERDYYYRKLESLKKAGLLIAISASTRQEAINGLGLSPENVVNISAAVNDKFRPIELSEEQKLQLRTRYGIERKMVMYAPGGFGARKNFDGLIKAYALLPEKLRAGHQLVIASKIEKEDRLSLRVMQKDAGLAEDELVLAGDMSEADRISLHNITTLFIYPTKQEGFALPVLEAMACGVPTIGSNTASVSEIIGWSEALFDPTDPHAIEKIMGRALSDELFQRALCVNATSQAMKFSWDTTARNALNALASLHCRNLLQPTITVKAARPKLAFISPLPPERSGISDYSAELLPELAKHYDIDVIVAQSIVTDPWVLANLQIRTVDWFRAHAGGFDRILYQFGNSPFHSHMLGLLRAHPGVVVLHDFFLSGLLANEEMMGRMPGVWSQALYDSHGYMALKARFVEDGVAAAMQKYPVNLAVLQQARALILHSDYSRRLIAQWFARPVADTCKVIPLCRAQDELIERRTARKALNIGGDDFVVCSFGLLGVTKQNHRLLKAWLTSSLARNQNCSLIFVGQNHGDAYGNDLLFTIEQSGLKRRIYISGWTDKHAFRQYLAAADAAVQLRSGSRGETSAAVLDCMNNGLPTIVNANGSMDELAKDAVLMMPDEFSDEELVAALESLYCDAELRKRLSQRAKEVILSQHGLESCASQYVEAIESVYAVPSADIGHLIGEIVAQEPVGSESELLAVSEAIAGSMTPQPALRQFLVDVTSIAQNDLKTGIERVVRAQLLELLKNPPAGYRIEPVRLSYLGGQWRYFYACSYTCKLLDIPQGVLAECPIDMSPGDVLWGADFVPHSVIEVTKAGLYHKMKAQGVSINFQVYDLLPILNSDYFPEGAASTHFAWLEAICDSATNLVCISEAVAVELRAWMDDHIPSRKNRAKVVAVHLGADIDATAPTSGVPKEAAGILASLAAKPTFLMVGTIEPRKGHLQTLAAFEQLWAKGIDVNLVVVGYEGWRSLPNSQRRTIPKIVALLSSHPELDKRLFWLKGVSDEYLEKLYVASTCLIAASEGEGFGLPLIEAAQKKLPILARNIPVFREVAGKHASYFKGAKSEDLAVAIEAWLQLYKSGVNLESESMPWLTWRKSIEQLVDVIFNNRSGA